MFLCDDHYTKVTEAVSFHFCQLYTKPITFGGANEVFVSKSDYSSQSERLSYQKKAMTDLKVLGYMALISMEQGCVLLYGLI